MNVIVTQSAGADAGSACCPSVSRPTVIQWRNRHAAERFAGVADAARLGRPTHVDEDGIVAANLSPPPDSLGVTHWSIRILAGPRRGGHRHHPAPGHQARHLHTRQGHRLRDQQISRQMDRALRVIHPDQESRRHPRQGRTQGEFRRTTLGHALHRTPRCMPNDGHLGAGNRRAARLTFKCAFVARLDQQVGLR